MKTGLHEECGVFGVIAPHTTDVASMTYVALYALQHRGQESCGIVVNDRGVFSHHKDLGLVPEVFNRSHRPRGGEKQKAKFIYGVLEKPFRNYYKKADQMKGLTGLNLMTILESRIDNVIFRLGFARTRKEARQIVDHKFVTVNGKVVNIPSYLVKAGDVIEIKESKKNTQRMKDIVEVAGGRIVPEWLDVDAEKLQGTVKDLPTREQIDVPVDEMLIVELYSK